MLDLMVNLPPQDVRRVLNDVERRVFRAGELICHEEAPCDALFLIESGEVRIVPHQPEADSPVSAGTSHPRRR